MVYETSWKVFTRVYGNKKKNTDFIKLCLNSDLAKEITIQPIKRFDLDAAIIFSDILMVPYGLGQNVTFKKGYGPQLKDFQIDVITKVSAKTFTKNLKPVYEAIGKVSREIGKKLNRFCRCTMDIVFIYD